MFSRLRKLRRNSPAPISSNSESAICPATITLPSPPRAGTLAVAFPSRSARLNGSRVMRSAGAMPKSSPVSTDTANVKPSIRGSGAITAPEKPAKAEAA